MSRPNRIRKRRCSMCPAVLIPAYKPTVCPGCSERNRRLSAMLRDDRGDADTPRGRDDAAERARRVEVYRERAAAGKPLFDSIPYDLGGQQCSI